VVSHDRYFLNRVADMLIVIGDGKTEVVFGNYDTYELLRAARGKPKEPRKSAERDDEQRSPSGESRPGPSAKPAKRKRKYPYRKVPDLEADIAATEAQARQLEESLASPDLYRDANRLKETMRAFDEAKAKLHQLYDHWEEAVELN
jgi:ATP-binding cassette subfamily F protein 3